MSKHRDKWAEAHLLDLADDRRLSQASTDERTAALNAQLRTMTSLGYSCRELGAMLGVSHQTVWKATQIKP